MEIFKEKIALLINSIITDKITDKNKNVKTDVAAEITIEIAERLIKLPPDSSYGDYSVASFYLNKYGFNGKPDNIALEFLEEANVKFSILSDYFDKIETKGPYVNFFVKKNIFIAKTIESVLSSGNSYGNGAKSLTQPNQIEDQRSSTVSHQNEVQRSSTVVIDFSSPNIAKPFGVGHLRSTAIGMSLSNIYEFCGYNVVKINYLGDFGTQFGKLLTAFCLYQDIDFEEFEKTPIKVLYDLYVRIHKEAENNPAMEEESRIRFKKLEEKIIKKNECGFDEYLGIISLKYGKNLKNSENSDISSSYMEDKDPLSNSELKLTIENKKEFCGSEDGQFNLWQLFRNLSIDEFKRIYDLMGISFNVYEGESQSAEFANEIVDILIESELAKESEGAIIIPFEDIKTPALIAKSDGTSLYLSRDIVMAILRAAKYAPSKIIYVVGSEQSLHFSQLSAIFKLIKDNSRKFDKYPFFQKFASGLSEKIEHVKFGRIIGMSTRKGNLVFLEDYINEAKSKAMEKIAEGIEGGGENESKKAFKIGLGAVIFNDLKTRRATDINFNWDNVLSFEGQTGPYLQYTAARIGSLMNKLTENSLHNKDENEVQRSSNRGSDNNDNNDNNDDSDNKNSGNIFFDINNNYDAIKYDDDDFNEIYDIVKQISLFSDTIKESLSLNEPSVISTYVLELASLFNKYYQNFRLIGRDSDYIKPRLQMLLAIKIILVNAMNLLCIPVLERM